ncbi:MAG: hypothetical protein NTW19_02450 [Planctomycetota bacterium]|nr:hypothetical protein [Planctomycetota bacterium]
MVRPAPALPVRAAVNYALSMLMDVISVSMRYLHIVSAVVAVGGMAFMLLCVSPAAKLLEEKTREELLDALHGRFLRVVWACIAGLIVSGTYNWIMLAEAYRKLGPKGNALIGTKVLLALIVFGVVWARSAGFIGKAGRRRVLMINIHLAAVVILLGAVLRQYRQEMPPVGQPAVQIDAAQGDAARALPPVTR